MAEHILCSAIFVLNPCVIMESQEVINEGMRKDIEFIKENLEEINVKLDQKYVTHQEFEPVKKLVYGLVALLLTSVIVAIVSLVLGS